MKLNLRSLLVALLSLATLSSCASTGTHKHTFSCVVDEAYRCTYVSCFAPATYFKSCECGAISEETFEYGQRANYCFTSFPEDQSYSAIFTDYDEKEVVKVAENILCPIIINKCIGDFSNVKFRRYSFSYETIDLNNSRLVLSGAITFPLLNGEPYVNFVNVDSHATIVPPMKAPSLGFDIFSILGLGGGLVIELDLLGMGITAGSPLDYHCHHLAARNTVDGIIAARRLIEDQLFISLEGKKFYNTGYSQGGYDAMALMRYMETEATDYEKSMIHFDYNFCGSGAYDLKTMFENSLKDEDYDTPEFLLMGLMSAYSFHKEIFGDLVLEDFLTDYGKCFIQPVLEQNQDEIDFLKDCCDENGNRLYQEPSDFFNFDFDNPDPKKLAILQKMGELETLINGEWLPEGRLTIFYLPNDNIVSPGSSLEALELFEGLENVKYVRGFIDDHGTGAVLFYLYCLLKIVIELQ